jgi:hypothetical protein
MNHPGVYQPPGFSFPVGTGEPRVTILRNVPWLGLGLMRLAGRLERLERVTAASALLPNGTLRRKWLTPVEEAWAVMLESMSEEHAVMVAEAYAQGLHDAKHPDWGSPAGTLLRRCLDALWRRPADWPDSLIRPEVALAMPPVVAEVYFQDPNALPLHECEDCGYRLPLRYFQACPLCGGRVGWYAFRRKLEETQRAAGTAGGGS